MQTQTNLSNSLPGSVASALPGPQSLAPLHCQVHAHRPDTTYSLLRTTTHKTCCVVPLCSCCWFAAFKQRIFLQAAPFMRNDNSWHFISNTIRYPRCLPFGVRFTLLTPTAESPVNDASNFFGSSRWVCRLMTKFATRSVFLRSASALQCAASRFSMGHHSDVGNVHHPTPSPA